jgi:hypothetical protein
LDFGGQFGEIGVPAEVMPACRAAIFDIFRLLAKTELEGLKQGSYPKKLGNCSACHFDERGRGEILRNIEKDFLWRLAPQEMTGK